MIGFSHLDTFIAAANDAERPERRFHDIYALGAEAHDTQHPHE